ncbi:ankyrin repeat-containing domain protein [Hypoxylon fragiforme]|uniref:ankyrin repeat-containing domain protein n=1 Tax=Hypoxylon fragiforme TaxID=63214 RepID=UPI0020C71DE3|nr:ankyrin repeat-containing domain protein [Hypoxylon fragiforme]KAI2604056.1 ankyrin repeat-containing domain protein [Hypoxylon fragiforme]
MASLRDFYFPTELLFLLAEFVDDISTLRALSAASREYHDIFNPVLYSCAAKNHPYLLTWACEVDRIDIVEKLLIAGANPNIAVGSEEYDRYERERWLSSHTTIDMTDPMNILDNIYDHTIWSNTITPWRRSHVSGPVYDPAQHDYPWHDIWDQPADLPRENPQEYCEDLLQYWFPLHAAAISGSTRVIQMLLSHGAYIETPSMRLCPCYTTISSTHDVPPSNLRSSHWTPLHIALCCRNEAAANCLLTLGGASAKIDARHRWGDRYPTALQWAARSGFISTAQLILDDTGDTLVNKQAPDGCVPLVWALGSDNSIEMMSLLLQYGATVNGWTEDPLAHALRGCWYKEAKFLIEHYTEISSESSRLRNLLTQCIIKLLNFPEKRYPMLPNQYESNGYEIRLYQRELAMRELDGYKLGRLQHAPDPIFLNEEVHFTGMMEIILLLLPYHIDMHEQFLVPASAGHLTAIVETFLSAGVKVDEATEYGISPLLAAAESEETVRERGRYETIECLLRHGASPDEVTAINRTALVALCEHLDMDQKKQLDIIKLMVDHGADINRRSLSMSESGIETVYSPLQAAFRFQRLDICRYLVDLGAKVSHEEGDLLFMLQDLLDWYPEFVQPPGPDEEVVEHTADPITCPVEFCTALRFILSLDDCGWLCKNPEALKCSTHVHHFPLKEMLLQSKGAYMTWLSEHPEYMKGRLDGADDSVEDLPECAS